MDNASTGELSENANENEWVVINEATRQVDDNGTVQLPEKQKDSTNKVQIIQTEKNGIEVLYENIDTDDTSNDVSVITESDIDAVNENFSSTRQDNVYESEDIDTLHHDCQVQNAKEKRYLDASSENFFPFLPDYNTYRAENIVDKIIHCCNDIVDKSKNNIEVLNTISCILLGCIIGISFGYFSLATSRPTDDSNLYTNGLKDLQTECHRIISTFKEVNTTLHEIKAHIITENKLSKDHAWQLLQNFNHPNKMNNKRTMESLNNDPHLDRLQVFLNILSLLDNDIYDNNNLLKSEMDKTLDVVNDTKIFYETLVSFNNSTLSVNVSEITQILQNTIDKVHHTTRSIFTDLEKKVNGILSNIHNKYSKMRHKLNEKLCHLKNILPADSEFLKQLTEKSKFLNNFDKYCYWKKKTRKFNEKTSRDKHTRANDTKEQIKETDNSVMHTKREKRDTRVTEDGRNYDKVTNDHSQPTKAVDQNTDETLNNSFDETASKHNTKATSDYGKISADGSTKVEAPKPDNHFKSNRSTKKVFNHNKPIKQNIKMRNYIPKSDKVKDYKHSFEDKRTKQDHQQTKSTDWLFERSNGRQKLRQAWNTYSEEDPGISKDEDKIYTLINEIVRKFGKNIDEAMSLLERRKENIRRVRSFL